MALVPLGTAAAPASRELLAAPLICSFTVKVQAPALVESVTRRLALQDDGAEEVLLGQQQLRFAVAVHVGGAEPGLGDSRAPPGGATSSSSKSLPGTWRRILTFS